MGNNSNQQEQKKGSSCGGCIVFILFIAFVGAAIIPTIVRGIKKISGKGQNQNTVAVTTETSTESKNLKEGQDYSYDVEKNAVIAEDSSGLEYVSNIVLVYFTPSAAESDKEAVVSKLNGSIVGRFDTVNQLQIKVDSKNYDELMSLCKDIETMNNVVTATVDTVVTQEVEPFYPSDGYEDTWDENYPGGQNWGQEAVKAPGLWAYKDIMSSIPVAVIDTGFDSSHPDLNGNISISSSSKDPMNAPEHGTLTSGLIGAGFSNGIGITGMAPNASLTGYSLGKREVTHNEIYAFLIQAVKDGNKVINISFGNSKQLKDCTSTKEYASDGKAASSIISSLLESGYDFIVVQAAGNGAADDLGVDTVYSGMFCGITEDDCYVEKHSYNEIIDHIVIVSAVTLTDNGYVLDSYSNGGTGVTLCAPGTGIYCLTPGGNYGYTNGTSLSAPIVSGAIAGLWGMNTSLSAKEIKSILCNSCSEFVPTNPKVTAYSGTYPMLNAGRAADEVFATIPDQGDDGQIKQMKSEYLDLLLQHESAIKNYRWQMGDDSEVAYPVAFRDLNSDGYDELIFMEAVSNYSGGISIYTYNEGLKEIYSNEDLDVQVAGGSRFYVAALDGCNDILVYKTVIGEEYAENYYLIQYDGDRYKLAADYERYSRPINYDCTEYDVTFYKDGNEIDESGFYAFVGEKEKNIDKVLMYSEGDDIGSLVSQHGRVNMTFEEAIAYLSGSDSGTSNGGSYYGFLKELYDNADDYYDGNPVYRGESGAGGDTAWLEYIVLDFDNDGEDELLIRKAVSKDLTYSTNGLNMNFIDLYEFDGNSVKLKKELCFGWDPALDYDATIYNNQVVYCKWKGYDIEDVYIFNDDDRNRLGLTDPEYLSYSLNNDGTVNRHHPVSYLGDGTIISKEEYENELQSVLVGNKIEYVKHQLTDIGISEISE